MPFTISPTEAQAIQEDEAQLLNAIAQIAQRIPGVLQLGSNGNGQSSDALRIKMGRRLVYGQLADGPFRHELDVNTLKVIAEALQQPVSSGFDPEKYARKIPAIEIFHGDVLLFREERDGTITANEIYFQVEQKDQQTQGDTLESSPESIVDVFPPKDPNPVVSAALPANGETVDRGGQLLLIAQHLLNPLRQPTSIYDEVSIHGYQIQKNGQDITVRQGERLVITAHSGELIDNHVTEQDWATLSAIQVPERFPKPVLNDFPKPVVNEALPVQNLNGSQAEPAPSTEPFLQEAVPGEDRTIQEPNNVGVETKKQSAIAVLDQATQTLPASLTRQLLQATVQDWRQQMSQRFSNRLQQGTNWLSTQHTALQNQRLAHAVHRLFQRGYERTGEHSYHVRGCSIKRRGQNLYVLKDAVGELMKFKTSKVLGFGRKMTVLSVSDRLTHRQRQNLLENQLDATAMPQGSLDVEAAYAAKTQKVEQTIRQFLTNFAQAHTWNRENGQFKLEIGEGDALRITDKQDGRGTVFERHNGEVSSKLGGQDFAHFERLATKMQTIAARQSQSASSQVTPENNGFKKTSAIEMD
ncbi:MAG: hypothetical protein AAFV90_24525 [Cyanobacteria bacterium J06634_5]